MRALDENGFADPEEPGKTAVFTGWLNAQAIKTPEFALSEWFDEQGDVPARMLFDHGKDRDETINLADEPEYRDRVEAMHRELMQNIQEGEVIRVASPLTINRKSMLLITYWSWPMVPSPLPKFVHTKLFP